MKFALKLFIAGGPMVLCWVLGLLAELAAQLCQGLSDLMAAVWCESFTWLYGHDSEVER